MTGTVCGVVKDKGFFFVRPDAGTDLTADVFVHYTALLSPLSLDNDIWIGVRVAFETEFDSVRGKWRGRDVCTV